MIAAHAYSIGEQPGTGSYRCTKCRTYVAKLLHPQEQLPPCENCGSAKEVRYEPVDAEASQSHGPRQ